MDENVPSLESVLYGTGLLSNILSLLEHPCDRDALACTSRFFRDAMSHDVTRITCRQMDHLDRVIRRFPNVTAFDVSPMWTNLKDSHIHLLVKKLPDLKEMRAEKPWKLTDEGLKAIGKLTSLRCLHIGDVENCGELGLRAIGEGCSSLVELRLDLQQNKSFLNLNRLQGLLLQGCGNRLESLTLTLDKPLVGKDCLPLILGCKNLNSLTLRSHIPIYFNQLENPEEIFKCRGLKTLEVTFWWQAMHKTQISMDGLIKIAVKSGAPLEIVELAGGFTGESLQYLGDCTSLRSFCLQQDCNNLGNRMKRILASNPHLTHLSIQHTGDQWGEDITKVISEHGQKLEKLVLVSLNPLECDLKPLERCSSLKTLSLSQITSSALPSLPHFPSLETLMLVYVDSSNLHAGSFSSLTKCRRLRRLVLTGTGSRNLEAISGCKTLEELVIPMMDVFDGRLRVILRGLPNLCELDIDRCKQIHSFGFLEDCPKLEKLTLNSTYITDEGLAVVGANCHRLRHLQLSLTRISDVGLCHLVQCTRLQELDLYGCDSVIGTGIETLANACPWLKEVRPGYSWRRFLGPAYH